MYEPSEELIKKIAENISQSDEAQAGCLVSLVEVSMGLTKKLSPKALATVVVHALAFMKLKGVDNIDELLKAAEDDIVKYAGLDKSELASIIKEKLITALGGDESALLKSAVKTFPPEPPDDTVENSAPEFFQSSKPEDPSPSNNVA